MQAIGPYLTLVKDGGIRLNKVLSENSKTVPLAFFDCEIFDVGG
jgi:hypothetical protein